MSIFQKSVINNHLSQLDKDQVDKAFAIFNENYSFSKITEIQKMKEEEYQDGFLRDIFVDVFGYTLKPADNYNLAREFKNQTDGKKADGAILKNQISATDKEIDQMVYQLYDLSDEEIAIVENV